MSFSEKPVSTPDQVRGRLFPGLPAAAERLERALAGISGLGAELLLDAQELIVFGGAIGPRERAGLDLTAVRGDCKIGNCGVLGLAGTVRHHRGVACLVRSFDRG